MDHENSNEALPPLFAEEAVVSEAELIGETEPGDSGKAESSPTPEPEPGAPLEVDFKELELEAESQGEPVEDFKVLTRDEYRELWENDPDAAALYLYEHGLYQERVKKDGAAKNLTMSVLSEASREIEKILPGFYNGTNQESSKLAEFAIKNGADPKFLELLTRPDLRVVTKPGGKPVLLGKGAASLIRMIKNLRDKTESRQKRHPAQPKKGSSSNKGRITGLQAERAFTTMTEDQQEAYLRGE